MTPIHAANGSETSSTTLRELGLTFLRLGATAFGGPAAHVALLREEVVVRRRWLSEAHFLDLLSAANLIPGPNSTELAIHIGWERRGGKGLAVAGIAFILPGLVLTWLLAWAYVRYGTLPATGWILYGIKPVILAVVVQAIWKLAPHAAKNTQLRLIAAIAGVAAALGAQELLVLFGCGLASLFARRRPGNAARLSISALLPLGSVGAASASSSALTLPSIFFVFLKIGSVLFGSGYVLLAFLRADLVERLGWLDESQLIDAVAVGQLTPGPVFTTVTFLGYVLAGTPGALAATAGIFLPAFVFVALTGPLVPRLRASERAAAFLDGVNVASLALMAVVTAQLASAAVVDPITAALAAASAILLVKFDLNSTWLIGGGATAGWLAHQLL